MTNFKLTGNRRLRLGFEGVGVWKEPVYVVQVEERRDDETRWRDMRASDVPFTSLPMEVL